MTTTTTMNATPAKKASRSRRGKGARPSMDVDVSSGHDAALLGGPDGLPHVLSVPVDQLAAHPSNVRFTVDGLDEMADSMRELGVLERLLVAPAEASSGYDPDIRYVVIAGHRRHAAAQLAGLTEVPVEVRYDLDTEARQIEAMCVENIHRRDLTPVEEAAAYQALLDLGVMDDKAIAKATGRSLATVRKRLRLARAPEPVRAAVHAHQVSLDDLELLWASEGDPAHGLALGVMETVPTADAESDTDAIPGPARRDDVRERLAEVANIAQERKKLKATVAATVDAGVALVEVPGDWAYYSTPALPRRLGSLPWHAFPEGLSYDERRSGDWHANCPGAGIVDHTDNVENPSVWLVCTTPDVHSPASKGNNGGAGLSDEEKASRAAEREARKRQREAQDRFDVAATVRRGYLTNLIARGAAPARAGVLTDLLLRASLTHPWSDGRAQHTQRLLLTCQVLGQPATDDLVALADGSWRSLQPLEAYADEVLRSAKPAPALLAVTAALCETILVGAWTPLSPVLPALAEDWLQTCKDYLDYDLTDTEITLLVAAQFAALDGSADEPDDIDDESGEARGVETVAGDIATDALGSEDD